MYNSTVKKYCSVDLFLRALALMTSEFTSDAIVRAHNARVTVMPTVLTIEY